MAIRAMMIPMLLAGMLPATTAWAAKPVADTACAPFAAIPRMRDVAVTTLSMQPADGRCVVEVSAANGNALRRQQRVLEGIAQQACGTLPEVMSADVAAVSLQLRMPATCAGQGSGDHGVADLFAGDPAVWSAPRGLVPRYPPQAVMEGLSGRSMLKVLLNAQGAVVAVALAASSGHAVLDEAAVEEVRRWHFIRNEVQGAVPALSVLHVPMRYELTE